MNVRTLIARKPRARPVLAAGERAMDMWEPRRMASLAQARRRTDMVMLLRMVFASGAVIAAGTLVGFVAAHGFGALGPSYSAASGVGVTMLNPRFDGRDANGAPYVIVADTARRRREDVNLIDLVNPRLSGDTETEVVARQGLFNREAQVLDLVGDVVMSDASGYVFTTASARMLVQENRIEGATPLEGSGPLGEVRGDTYEVLDGGSRIILRGNVWSRIVPEDE
jgi:lipopolysaccharide export system protein LptC